MPPQMAAIEQALQRWSDLTGITFQRVNDAGSQYSNSATMLFGCYNANDGAGAYAYYPGSTDSAVTAGDVWLNLGSVSTTAGGLQTGSYSFFAIMHEIGHAIGLSHPGLYNAALGTTITYANNAQFVQDTQQYSIMSYFDESYTGASFGGYADTPMLFDVMAIQNIYGTNTTTRSGATVYGYGSTAGSTYDFSINSTPGLCIWDGGGRDTLDCSGYSGGQTIDLRSGYYSSTNGLTSNVVIAYGTTIENAAGGSGNDVLTGNTANNVLRGNAGTDNLNGGAGFDTAVFSGSSASYTITRSGGVVTISGADGTDTLTNIEVARFADRSIALRTRTNDDVLQNGHSELIFRNDTTGHVGLFDISGRAPSTWATIAPSSTDYTIAGVADFLGDGSQGILFRNSNTCDTGFYRLNQDGSFGGWISVGPSATTYGIVGTGDFNGDGQAEILFRNNLTGDTGYYRLNESGRVVGWGSVGPSSTAYRVVDVADFNGDGTSDIMFRNATNGDTGWYTMQNGSFAGWSSLGWTSTSYSVVGDGDFYGDGTSEALFRNASTGNMGFYTISGGTTQWHSISTPVGYDVTSTGDYNGDGTTDVLFRNSSTGDTTWLQINAGVGTSWHSLGGTSLAYNVYS